MEVSMRFADEDLPEIKSGLYELEIGLNTGIREDGTEKQSKETIHLVAAAKRFSMDPGEVYSVYPAAGSEGEFSNCLPILCSAGGLCRGSSGAGTEARGWLYSSVRRMRE